MSYVPGTTKWGDTIGSSSGGPVTWSADYFDALTVDPASSEGDFDIALQLAFDQWESVAAIDFELDTSGAATDITIGARSLTPPIAGVAEIRSIGAEIIDVDVFFSTNIEWAPNGSGAPDFFGDFFAVALHEIGHAIGLEHVPDASEIMNATIFADDLGNGDIAAAQYLYGRDDGDAPLADAEQVEAPSTGIPVSDGGGGGGGGGAIAAILGLLALVFGFAPLGAVAAAGTLPNRNEGDEDTVADGTDYPDLSEVLPTVPVTESHVAYLAGFGEHTGLPGCGCSACHQMEMEEESDFFL